LQFVAFSAVARLYLEAFRGDSVLIMGNLRLAQALAWVILTGAFAILEIKKVRSDKTKIAP
jgi:prolipoprotein diacylglyceryltransferase